MQRFISTLMVLQLLIIPTAYSKESELSAQQVKQTQSYSQHQVQDIDFDIKQLSTLQTEFNRKFAPVKTVIDNAPDSTPQQEKDKIINDVKALILEDRSNLTQLKLKSNEGNELREINIKSHDSYLKYLTAITNKDPKAEEYDKQVSDRNYEYKANLFDIEKTYPSVDVTVLK